MATANPDILAVPQPSDWFGILKQYGLATFISVIALTYLGFLFEMNRREQQKITQSIVATNEARAENEKRQINLMDQNSQSQIQTTFAIDRMSKALEESNRLQQRLLDAQQQLLDATRRGAWLEHNKNGSGT